MERAGEGVPQDANVQIEMARARVEREINLEKWHDRWEGIGNKILTAAALDEAEKIDGKNVRSSFGEIDELSKQAVDIVKDMDPMDDSDEAQKLRGEYRKMIADIKARMDEADAILEARSYDVALRNSERLAKLIAETEAEQVKLESLVRYNGDESLSEQLEELKHDLESDKAKKAMYDKYLAEHPKKEKEPEPKAEFEPEPAVDEPEPEVKPEETEAEPEAEVKPEEPESKPEEAEGGPDNKPEGEPVVESEAKPEEPEAKPEEAEGEEMPEEEPDEMEEFVREFLTPEAPEAKPEKKKSSVSEEEVMEAFRKARRERLVSDTKEVAKNKKSRVALALAGVLVLGGLATGGRFLAKNAKNDIMIAPDRPAVEDGLSDEARETNERVGANIFIAGENTEEDRIDDKVVIAGEEASDYDRLAEDCEYLSVGTINDIREAAKGLSGDRIRSYDANVDPTIWHGDANAYYNKYNVSKYRIEGANAQEVSWNYADKYVGNSLEMAVTEAMTLNLFGLGGESVNAVSDFAREIEGNGLSDEFRAIVAAESRKLDTSKMKLGQIPKGAMYYSEQRDHDDDDSIEESVRIVDGTRDEAILDRTDALTPEQKKLILEMYHVDAKDDEYDIMFVTRLGCGQSGVVLVKKVETAVPVVTPSAYEDVTEDPVSEPEQIVEAEPEQEQEEPEQEVESEPEPVIVTPEPEPVIVTSEPEPEPEPIVIAPKTEEQIERSFEPMNEAEDEFGTVGEGGQEQLTVREEVEPEGGEGRTFEEIQEEGIGITEEPTAETWVNPVSPEVPETGGGANAGESGAGEFAGQEPQVTSDDELEAMLNEFLENNIGQ